MERIGDINLKLEIKKWKLMKMSEGENKEIELTFNTEDQREEFC
jgi:hypothetical protein